MAEGGEVSGRRGDLIKNCLSCSNKGMENRSKHYCFMCKRSFCQECTVKHNVLFIKHRVTELQSANIGRPVSLYTEPCPEHGKALTLYCKDNDSICCEECPYREQLSCRENADLPPSTQAVPVRVKKKYQVDVPVRADNSTCSISGSCVLHDGSILLAEFISKTLKRLDQHSLKVKDQCSMRDRPRDVCVINDSEVAVTQQNNALVIVSVRPHLTPIRSISMSHGCACVAYCQEELFITDNSRGLYIYNMEGCLLRKVSTDQSGQNILFQACHIIINAAADKVYVADLDKGLITLDREGQVQDKLVINKILGTRGLCLDGIGGIFICGVDSNNVVHMSEDGQILTEVLTSSDGLVKPLSLCYDRLHKRLIVTQNLGKQIHVCELE